MTRIVDRIEDMSVRGRLRLIQQDDGDIIVAVQPEQDGLIQGGDSVEFCVPGAGGGRSTHTLAALRALMDAMERDNLERPIATEPTKPLTQCAAGRDGDCAHAQCPQLRDGEPAKSSRHCPLDTQQGED